MANSFEGLFGEGSSAEQFLLWNVASQLVGAVLGPINQAILNGVWKLAAQDTGGVLFVPLSPADLAQSVVRGVQDQSSAADTAALSGTNADDFGILVDLAGEPPGLDFVLQAFRRGYVGWADTGVQDPSVVRAILTSRVYPYWQDVIQKMLVVPLSPSDAVNAVVRGQIDQDAGAAIAYASGISADDFQTLINTTGRPPSPTELIELVRRNLIPFDGTGPTALTFEQGIYEGDTKDKWQPLYQKLSEYIPPPRTVTTLYRTGAITEPEAQQYYQMSGLSPDLAAAYGRSISGEKLEGTKQLAEGTVRTLYEAGAIDNATATGYLNVLGYSATEAAFVLEVADLQREVRALNSAVSRIGTLYTGWKISRQGAANGLTELGIADAYAARLLDTWDTVRASNVREPTASEIGKAVYYGGIPAAEGLQRLQQLGYDAYDAYVVLTASSEAPPAGVEPPALANPPELIP